MLLDHARTIADLPDEYLSDIGPVVKKVAIATGAENYNVIQVCYVLFFTFCQESINHDVRRTMASSHSSTLITSTSMLFPSHLRLKASL